MSFAKYIFLAMSLFTSSIALRIDTKGMSEWDSEGMLSQHVPDSHVKREVMKQAIKSSIESGTGNSMESDTHMNLQDTQKYDNHKPKHKSSTRGAGFGKLCEAPTKPKVAVCVFGLARSLVRPEIYSGFKQHIVEALANQNATGLSRQMPDVFAHLKTGSDKSGSPDKQVSRESIQTAVKEIGMLKSTIVDDNQDKYNPLEFSQETVGNQQCWGRLFTEKNSWRLKRTLAMHWSIQECHKMIVAEEEQQDVKYDVVVFERADLAIDTDVPLPEINCESATFHHDFWMTMPRKVSDLFGNMLNDYLLSAEPRACGKLRNPEAIVEDVAAHMREKGVSAKYVKNKLYPNTQGKH